MTIKIEPPKRDHITEPEHIKTAYNRNHAPIFDCYLPIHLFGTGSEGNSVFFKDWNLLIDIGLPMKKYDSWDKNFFSNIDFIILTHIHGDHFNPSTVYHVLKNYPNINFIITDRMLKDVLDPRFKAVYEPLTDAYGNVIKSFNKNGTPGKPYYKTDENGEKIIVKSPWLSKFSMYTHRFYVIDSDNIQSLEIPCRNRTLFMLPCTTKHGDIENLAIVIYDTVTDEYILYASDLDNLGGKNSFKDHFGDFLHITGLPTEYTFSKMFLEANYDDAILDEWGARHVDTAGKARVRGSKRHISEKEAFAFVQKHLADNGIFIPLHASKTFGTLLQYVD